MEGSGIYLADIKDVFFLGSAMASEFGTTVPQRVRVALTSLAKRGVGRG